MGQVCSIEKEPQQIGYYDTPQGNRKAYMTPGKGAETPMSDFRKMRTAPGLSEYGSAARNGSAFSWAEVDQIIKSTKGASYNPDEIKWSEQEIKQARTFALRHINIDNNSYDPLIGKMSVAKQNKKAQKWIRFCGPSCQIEHQHVFEYDYTKSFKDPIAQRPGIDFIIEPKYQQEAAKLGPGQVCQFGKKQTPIDLSTNLKVLKNFEDKDFNFEYDEVAKNSGQLKFNQTGDQFFVDIAKGRSEKENTNRFNTQTISLFDSHIPTASLHGVQFHFHAPSEHSIDGKLLDLEMHIVHLLDKKPQHKNASFIAGVLGFFFKVMPEQYFEEMEFRYPHADIDWHDRFLVDIAREQENSDEALDMGSLDLTEFVQKLEFNKRWTYAGSLTTAPCDEGILWNVIENVIPIRQSTIDLYMHMREVEANQVTNKISDQDPKTIAFLEELKADIPDSKKSFKKNGATFMRIGGCNRKVQDQNDRPVYRIDLQD